jgi:hypothetical protein
VYTRIEVALPRHFRERSAEDMRKKTAFSESHFWENVGMLVFVLAGLVGLWYMMTNVIAW